MSEIVCENLCKRFGDQVVLNGVNLHCLPGEITVILGRSGEGKSVLLKHIIGLLTPDDGKVMVDGVDITKLNSRELNNVRRTFGYLFQDAALFDDMTVYENVSFPLREHRRLKESEIREIVHHKLEIVGLQDVDKKMPNELSGGMRKRVGLARAIVLEPKTILYDEPTTGLDPVMTATIDHLIQHTASVLHVTSIVISHDLKSAFQIGDHLAMLHQGTIVEHGSPELFRRSNHPIVQDFIRAALLDGAQGGDDEA